MNRLSPEVSFKQLGQLRGKSGNRNRHVMHAFHIPALTPAEAMSFAVKKARAVKPATGLQEDDEGEEDGQRHGDLLSGGGRQVERDHAEYGDEHGRHDEVDGVEERLAAQLHRVDGARDVLSRLLVDRVLNIAGHVVHVPRATLLVVRQVHLQSVNHTHTRLTALFPGLPR